ncbi:MAG: CPBP family intramembrane metalloprotease [Paludibacter sp.]|nr:CPBP family intramembrane metalloprotease [Paludibacter sp.]
MKSINKTTLFLILTFVISYSLAGVYRLLGFDASNRLAFTILGATYMFIPAICVVIVKKIILKENLKSDLFISFKINKWFFVAWLIMPIISFCTLGISLLFPDVTYSSGMTGLIERYKELLTPEQIEQMKTSLAALPVNAIWITLLQGLAAGITINAVAAFGEELAWRGFLLQQFKEMSFLKASLVIGFIWGIWHAPLILMGHNYPQHPQIGVFMMTILCILITPIFIYLTIKAKSVIAAAIAHGTMNATAGISIMLIAGGNDLTVGMTGLTGFIALAVFLIGIFVYDQFISKDKIMTKKISNYL